MATTSKPVLIFGREPALWAGLLNTIVFVLGAYVFHLSAEKEAVLVAVVAAILGVVVAISTHDGVSAAILGLVKAVFSLALGFGGHVSSEHVALWLSLAAAASALFVRTQATAKVSAAQLQN